MVKREWGEGYMPERERKKKQGQEIRKIQMSRIVILEIEYIF